jgi:hypothetical protein
MVAFHQDGEHQGGVIGPRGLPKMALSACFGMSAATSAAEGEVNVANGPNPSFMTPSPT